MKKIILAIAILLPELSWADEPQRPAPSEPDGVIGGLEYVDPDLPSGTLWATYNIGATSSL